MKKKLPQQHGMEELTRGGDGKNAQGEGSVKRTKRLLKVGTQMQTWTHRHCPQ